MSYDVKPGLSLLNDIYKSYQQKSKVKNYFASSLGSVVSDLLNSFTESPGLNTNEIENDLKKFIEVSKEILGNPDFVQNYGNYESFETNILQLVDSLKNINSFTKKFSNFSNNEIVFTKRMISRLSNQGKMAQMALEKITFNEKKLEFNELCWYFWLNNYPNEANLTAKELQVLYKFLEENLDFIINPEFKNKVERYLDDRGNYNLEVLNCFLENFSNVALLNELRSRDFGILSRSKEKNNVHEKGTKKLILRLIEYPETENVEEYFTLEDIITITNDGTFDFEKFQKKTAINPIADEKNFRIGRSAPNTPDVNILFPQSFDRVSRKQCSIDWDKTSFGLTCISQSNPTLFRLEENGSFPMEKDMCFLLASMVCFRVKDVVYSQEQIWKHGLVKIEEHKGTRKKKLKPLVLNPKLKATEVNKNYSEVKLEQNPEKLSLNQDETAKIKIEIVPFFTKYHQYQIKEFTFNVKNVNFSGIKFYDVSDPRRGLDKITIGRHENQAIHIIDHNDTRDVSRAHCAIIFHESKFKLIAVGDTECFMMLKTYTQFQDPNKIEPSDKFILQKGRNISIEGVVFEVSDIVDLKPTRKKKQKQFPSI